VRERERERERVRVRNREWKGEREKENKNTRARWLFMKEKHIINLDRKSHTYPKTTKGLFVNNKYVNKYQMCLTKICTPLTTFCHP
jgi:hypothetical protein